MVGGTTGRVFGLRVWRNDSGDRIWTKHRKYRKPPASGKHSKRIGRGLFSAVLVFRRFRIPYHGRAVRLVAPERTTAVDENVARRTVSPAAFRHSRKVHGVRVFFKKKKARR